jgi:hypothetical protein
MPVIGYWQDSLARGKYCIRKVFCGICLVFLSASPGYAAAPPTVGGTNCVLGTTAMDANNDILTCVNDPTNNNTPTWYRGGTADVNLNKMPQCPPPNAASSLSFALQTVNVQGQTRFICTNISNSGGGSTTTAASTASSCPSGQVPDICGVCGGNGSECVLSCPSGYDPCGGCLGTVYDCTNGTWSMSSCSCVSSTSSGTSSKGASSTSGSSGPAVAAAVTAASASTAAAAAPSVISIAAETARSARKKSGCLPPLPYPRSVFFCGSPRHHFGPNCRRKNLADPYG